MRPFFNFQFSIFNFRLSQPHSGRFAFLLLLFLALPLHATLTSSAITGRAIAGEAPAAGVTVTATSTVLQYPRTTVTGPRGTYWLGALPPGEYDVTFARAGMTTLTRRAIVELGRVARADARLEPSADEESVTSTATQTSVAGTTAITSHFDDETLDRFPGRDYAGVIAPDAFSGSGIEIDGSAPFLAGITVPEESIEQVTVVRGAAPVEYESYGGTLYAVRTRSGREQFFLSLRDTLSSAAWNEGGPSFGRDDDGVQNLFEANGGGRILPRRLWFFAALWSGDDATRYRFDERGLQLKLDAQLGAAHHLDATHFGVEGMLADSATTALRHTGAFGPRTTTETIVSRTSSVLRFPPQQPDQPPIPPRPREHGHFLSGRASHHLPARHGDHVLTAGASAFSSRFFDAHSFFVGDRWSSARWVVNAGLRYDDTPFHAELSPRVAVTYDLRGDGTRAIAASFGEYSFGASPAAPIRIATLGYAAAIGSSGTARVDVIRRGQSFAGATDSLQLDTRYRLFDRFEAGATYTYTRFDDDALVRLAAPDHAGNAWIGAQFPIGAHEFGVTLLQRYFRFYDPSLDAFTNGDSASPTDVALRYAIPFSRVGLMFAIDAANVFGSSDFAAPRTVRFWTRLRL